MNSIRGFLMLGLGYCLAVQATAQHNFELNNQGAAIYLQPGSEVHVWGDVHMQQATGTLENNGLLKVQGNMYSDELFQQRGTGTTLFENSDVNAGERQFISGSYAVRGGTAQIGVDDGSFYNLELNNDQGIVYLVNSGAGVTPQYVADVRGSVNFDPQGLGPANATSIVTSDIGTTGAIVYPANGSAYDAEFGMMNATAGTGNYFNSTWHQSGGNNMSAQDNGYIIGKHRRAISPAGGAYGYFIGLEPAGAGAARGFQYSLLDIDANTYDVISGYFEQGSDNTIAGVVAECTGYLFTSFLGTSHGEWIFGDQSGGGTGNYDLRIWPQDLPVPASFVFFITKDNAVLGTANDCGPTYVGLQRNGFNGFAPSEFGVAGSDILLHTQRLELIGHADEFSTGTILLKNSAESDVVQYVMEKAEAGGEFVKWSFFDPAGNDGGAQEYRMTDNQLLPGSSYQYRGYMVRENGDMIYSPTIELTIPGEGLSFFPNPLEKTQLLRMIPGSFASTITSIQIYDACGRLVDELSSPSSWLDGINPQNWPQGILYIKVIGTSFSMVEPVMVIR